ncbi:MAG: spermidine/putrescine ABC transporter substrate-binding protein [Oscillospiraceae bacterium]
MKKIISVLLALTLLLGTFLLSSCGTSKTSIDTSKLVGNYDIKELKGTELNVYNWGEYISDGTDGTVNVVKEFEKITGIKVNYNLYQTNEDLYPKIKSGGVNYDIVVPSDYMVSRFISEDLIQKLDFNNIPNYKYIAEDYKNVYFDEKNEYSVPYTGGMVAIVYNKTKVKEVPNSWNILWDKQYSCQILNFNNPRDAFGTAQYLLGYDVNSTNEAEWKAAAEKLKEQKPLIQSYVSDEIFDKMEQGEAAIGVYYAGDCLTMTKANPDLAVVYPKEGTNIFIDSMCIPKSAKNKAAAELFINFMCEPEVSLINAEFLGYLCPNTAVLKDDRYSLKDNEILYPKTEFKKQYFHNLDQKTLDLLSKLWDDVKLA